MKFKYSRLFPLSIVLSIAPVHHSSAQADEGTPLEAVKENIERIPPKADDALDSAERRIEEARRKLDEAKLEAQNAPDEGKARAMKKVEAAQKRLDVTIERSEEKTAGGKRDIEKRGPDKDVADQRKNLRDKPTPPEVRPADKTNRRSDTSEAGAASETGTKPEESKANATKENRKREKAAKPEKRRRPEDLPGNDKTNARRRVPQPDADPKPVTPPVSEATPEESVVSKQVEKEAKEADLAVDRTTREVSEKVERKKLNIKDEGEARDMIRDLIGAESAVSKAEATRETRLESREGDVGRQVRRGRESTEIRSASDFLLRQLSGKATPQEAPAFFRRPAEHDSYRGERIEGRRQAPQVIERTPRYYHEGRRYVRFDSRNSIPAILLAAAALDRVSVMPANRTDGYFPVDRGENRYANELPPENYRGDDAVVVSYPVSKSSMISSNDIIFAQGSTRFADGHSYDMVMALADAMANPSLRDARFIIEGHASAEGSYDENMALSQRRAEAIVRDMVREGIDPERLIPVGYGESEARYSADSPERLRSQDRNVKVFRTGSAE